MKILTQHIEKLLPDHDCVVVPGLGGLVQNEVPARYDFESDLFYPGGKELCFNSRLTFNDGFLAQAYQESFGISFEESNLQIRQGVQEIKDKIDEGKYVSLGRIGVIWKNDRGQLLFRSENKNLFFPESYGLTSFSFPSLDKRQKRNANADIQPRKRKEEEFINIRLRRNSFHNLIIGAAACLFMLLLSKPAGNLPETNSQEAFMMHDYLISSDTPKQKATQILAVLEKVPIKVDSNEASLSDDLSAKPNAVTKKDDTKSEPPTTTPKKPVEKEKTVQYASGRTFYIVVSSFPQKKLAEEWIKTKGNSATFRFSGIIEKDGRSRVYTRSFPDKKDAEAFLNQFRANNPEYASAWLLSAKNS